MRIFIYKSLIIFFLLYLTLELTIGYRISLIKKNFINVSSSENIEKLKNKIRNEISKGLQKEQILGEEDKQLISNFINKLIKEINFKNK